MVRYLENALREDFDLTRHADPHPFEKAPQPLYRSLKGRGVGLV